MSEASRAEVCAVVATTGASPYLGDALRALRRDGGEVLRIVLVHQGARQLPAGGELADEVLRLEDNRGFAAGTNRGLARAEAELVALVNDDVMVRPGWLASLRAALAADPRVAAVQGVNLRLDDPERVDGFGLGWNGDWQAVQLGHDEPAPPAGGGPREVFGVSATAALYRRTALEAVALPQWAGNGGRVLDESLGSYYEDVDLAIRLRARGWTSLSVTSARALHAGSATGARRPISRWALIHGNRLLVLARLLGREVGRALPRALARDARDLAAALIRLDLARAAGVLGGWGRAARRWRRHAHGGAPAIPPAELARWRVEGAR